MIKKIAPLLFLLATPIFAYDDVPLMIDNGNIFVEYEKSSNIKDNIEIKKTKMIKKIDENKEENKKPVIKLDVKQIQHQRALNYMDGRGNGIMPRF